MMTSTAPGVGTTESATAGAEPEVMASSQKMNHQIARFANKYRQAASPLDNPKKQAYMLGVSETATGENNYMQNQLN